MDAAAHHALAIRVGDLPSRASKTALRQNRSTLAALASLGSGEFTAEDVDAAHRGRSRYALVRLWELLAAGLVAGHGDDNRYVYSTPGVFLGNRPARFSITNLGRVALAWSRRK